MPDLSLVLAGFGNIGQAVAELIATDHPSARGLTINGVCDPRFGSVTDEKGLDAGSLLAAANDEGSFSSLDGGRSEADVYKTIDTASADVLVELTFTNLETGEPATSHIRHAISAGMSVSTTNKGPIALHLEDLERAARSAGVLLAYEGTVMSGTPALLVARDSIRDAGFVGATGILNGTTNFIITQMEGGIPYYDALAEAQARGYAEADPSGDVDGHDAAGKLAILSRALLEDPIPPGFITTVPLSTLGSTDIQRAADAGSKWRYVATLEREDSGWKAAVAPRQLSADHPLSFVVGATNALTFQTELLGEVTIVGPGAGRAETAYSVISDLNQIARARL